MRKHLLSWQWSGYPEAHRDRKNFILHLATVPLFDLGFLAVIASPLLGWAALAAGAVAMFGASYQLRGGVFTSGGSPLRSSLRCASVGSGSSKNASHMIQAASGTRSGSFM